MHAMALLPNHRKGSLIEGVKQSYVEPNTIRMLQENEREREKVSFRHHALHAWDEDELEEEEASKEVGFRGARRSD